MLGLHLHLGLHLGHQVDFAREKTHPESQQAQQELDLLTPIFKTHITEMANRLTGDAFQIFGGMGFIEETGVAQFYRDLRISTIYKVTTGIQSQDFLFRKLQSDNGELFYDWLNRIKTNLQPLSEHPECSSNWALLTRKVDVLRNTVCDLLEHQANNATRMHAASVALLEATGILALGWQLGLSVLAADNDGVIPKERNNIQAYWRSTARIIYQKFECIWTGLKMRTGGFLSTSSAKVYARSSCQQPVRSEAGLQPEPLPPSNIQR